LQEVNNYIIIFISVYRAWIYQQAIMYGLWPKTSIVSHRKQARLYQNVSFQSSIEKSVNNENN